MKYLAVLGRQPEISLAELTALFGKVERVAEFLATFESLKQPEIARLGGSLKIAAAIESTPVDFLKNLAEEGKITIGVSDYSKRASTRTAMTEALKIKKILVRHGKSVRVVDNKTATLSTATSLHNGLAGHNPRKIEFIKVENEWWRVIGVQNIEAYAKRDQARPARDAKVGMLPPKLAQILLNLAGDLPQGSRILDPFCGTGVVLQEALLMGYKAYGTDISERMVEYTKQNLQWLGDELFSVLSPRPSSPSSRVSGANSRQQAPKCAKIENNSFTVAVGDATKHQWQGEIDAVVCEGYLGKPMSVAPAEIKLKTEKMECSTIILGFLKNLAKQIKSSTPVIMAIPAWLRPNGSYESMNLLDEIAKLGYNVKNTHGKSNLLYHREGQIVAREIIILRKI